MHRIIERNPNLNCHPFKSAFVLVRRGFAADRGNTEVAEVAHEVRERLQRVKASLVAPAIRAEGDAHVLRRGYFMGGMHGPWWICWVVLIDLLVFNKWGRPTSTRSARCCSIAMRAQRPEFKARSTFTYTT